MKSRLTIFPSLSRRCWPFFALWLCVLFCGCNRFRPQFHEKVYVAAQKKFLIDRVAAVSNHTGEVTNGQKLEVLEHGRRFLKVKTEKNEIGWIEEHAVIDSKVYDLFAQMVEQHKNDPVIASAVIRDDVYLHILPGRDTEHFQLLPANAKVQLLVRATVPKVQAGPGGGHRIAPLSAATAPKPAAPAQPAPAASAGKASGAPAAQTVSTKSARQTSAASTPAVLSAPEPPPVIMEDWWLVRDAQGRTGWVLASRMDVDVPDSIAQYAEGQRIVGAYVLAKIFDDQSEMPDHQAPEYVMVLAPPKSGLPYDFDQVRVFTWSVKRHRYETAFRLHPIQGYLPINITRIPGPGGTVPAFGFKIATDENVSIDTQTGAARPAHLRTINYEMIDTVVKRVGPDLDPLPSSHNADAKAKDKTKNAKQAKQGKKRK